MRKVDIIVIATIMIALIGGAITALVVINQPPPRPESIMISTLPSRTTYARGETIVTTNMVITAVFKNGNIETFTRGFTLNTTTASNGSDPNATDQPQDITVTFRKATATFQIIVGPAELREMQLSSPPNKINYRVGEPFVATGFKATLVWTDRRDTIEYPHTGLTFSNQSTSTPGVRTVTATYRDVTTTFTIVVTT
jgi:hypothetical protein